MNLNLFFFRNSSNKNYISFPTYFTELILNLFEKLIIFYKLIKYRLKSRIETIEKNLFGIYLRITYK